MGIVSKLSVALMASACIGILTAQEIMNLSKPSDFLPTNRLTQSGTDLIVKPGGAFLSVKDIVFDPAKKYQVSGEVRMKAGKPTLVFFGLAPYDSKNRPILARMLIINKDSMTTVAESAQKGARSIKVKDASKWNFKSKYSYIAFGAQADNSDLPNHDVHRTDLPNAKKNGEAWEIMLKKPLEKEIAAGIPVRQHFDGDYYIYPSPGVRASDQWVTRTGIVTGISSDSGVYGKKFWKGAAKVKALVLVIYGNGKSETVIRNVKVTEVK